MDDILYSLMFIALSWRTPEHYPKQAVTLITTISWHGLSASTRKLCPSCFGFGHKWTERKSELNWAWLQLGLGWFRNEICDPSCIEHRKQMILRLGFASSVLILFKSQGERRAIQCSKWSANRISASHKTAYGTVPGCFWRMKRLICFLSDDSMLLDRNPFVARNIPPLYMDTKRFESKRYLWMEH